MTDEFMTEAMVDVLIRERCPACGGELLPPWLSVTGSERSLLQWRFCAASCGLWSAVCERVPLRPHLIVATPGPLAYAAAALSGDMLFPELVKYERSRCGREGHSIPVDMN